MFTLSPHAVQPTDTTLPSLIFPAFDVRTEVIDDIVKIYDVVRKSYVALTPEEWVRQHCIHWLLSNGYPLGRCSVERVITGATSRTLRYDAVWMDAELQPFLLIECKAPSHTLSDAVIRQSAWYNLTLKAPYVLITNGVTASCVRMHADGHVTPVDDLPPYPPASLD